MEIKRTSNNQEWDQMIINSPDSGFLQSSFWGEFREKVGWETTKIGLFSKSQLTGGAHVHRFQFKDGTNFLLIAEGPALAAAEGPVVTGVADFEEGGTMLINAAKDLADEKTSHLRVESRRQKKSTVFAEFRESSSSMEPRNTLVIDLVKPKSAILAAMKPKARYNIKVAEKHGVTVDEATNEAGLKIFLAIYDETLKRNQFAGKGDFYFQALLPMIQKPRTGKIFIASFDGKPCAAALVIFFGGRATYFFGGSSGDNRETMAPYKLYWEIMKYAKAQGYAEYDFWGVTPGVKDVAHPWAKISEFKRKFGGKQLDFLPTLDFVFNENLYRSYVRGESPS
jgi:lipid II:glycine glycyltransferase (peptidoglycan interpeptide bridge formation enzyme)